MPIARKYAKVIPRQSHKITLTQLILEKIDEAGYVLLDSFFPAKYPEARLWRSILGLDSSYEFKRPTFSTILSNLRTQGLVEATPKQGKRFWRLTALGRKTLANSRSATAPATDGKKRLVCFDIPERERAKRRWIRGELVAAGYQPLQKSVWIGDAPLPTEFIEALDALELRGRVHLLQVEEEGTLHET